MAFDTAMIKNKTQHRYKEIAENLRRRISSGEFAVAGMLPSEHDLARAFSVNRLTLRKAVGILEGEGLVTRHRGRGTFIGAAPVPQKAIRNFVFVGSICEHVWSEVYAELGASLQDQGHRLNCYQPDVSKVDIEFSSWLRAHTEDPAIICQRNCLPAVEACVNALGCPMVIIDINSEYQRSKFPMVLPDIHQAGFLAAEHLIGFGHRKLAFLGFGSDPAPAPGFFLPYPENPGFAGYQEAMRRANLPTDNLCMGTYGGGGELQRQIEAFLKHLGFFPSAFVCQQDFKARDIYAVAAACGLSIPRDLSVVSIGNTPWAEAMMPALSSVDLQPRAMARLALHILQDEKSDLSTICRIEPKLVSRESVATATKQ